MSKYFDNSPTYQHTDGDRPWYQQEPRTRLIIPRVFGWCNCGRYWEIQPPEVCPECEKKRNEDDPRIEER